MNILSRKLIAAGVALAALGAVGVGNAATASAATSRACSVWISYDPWSQRQGGHGVVFSWYAVRPIGSPMYFFYAKRDVQYFDNRSRYVFGNFRVKFAGQMKALSQENTYTLIGTSLTTPASLPFYTYQTDQGGSSDYTRTCS